MPAIRPAIHADLPAIVGIYNASIPVRQATADLQPVTVAEREAWFAAHGGTRPLYVLENEAGEVCGWGSFSDYYPRRAYHISAEISIYISPQAQGAGHGRRILEHMLAQAPDLGIRNVLAVIFAHNAASLALFGRYGFAEWGRLPQVCDLETRLADIVILGKALSPA
ncbi:N-acetyltransferase family protein [Eikenella sp. S3360]|uniref:N-acetyltransferase family protein n=1 Tax=Eikenella glucosivorans TaxID=2766967 RepID=A0ABS0N922_9NEIS|nr:GNAT family N-acetyltransferase [Eikenella glucosivorans]MBH5328806.1 N-acetyltransferase family protein [Eikenella glucosivorans]